MTARPFSRWARASFTTLPISTRGSSAIGAQAPPRSRRSRRNEAPRLLHRLRRGKPRRAVRPPGSRAALAARRAPRGARVGRPQPDESRSAAGLIQGQPAHGTLGGFRDRREGARRDQPRGSPPRVLAARGGAQARRHARPRRRSAMMGLAVEPFAPLDPAEIVPPPAAPADALVPIVPVPDDATEPSFWHLKHGEPAAVWTYRDADCRVLGHVARFDTPEGKQILPRSWCRVSDGSSRWAWKALAAPRPLYGLDRLAGIPEAPVLVVEGEKTADAAQHQFNGHVVVTWSGGSKATGKSDWSALSGRHVVIWPDADDPGR